MIKKVIAISGQSGSGKSLLASFFIKNSNFKVVSISKTMTEVFENMITDFYKISEKKRQTEILNLLTNDPDLVSETIYNKTKEIGNEVTLVLDGVRSEKDYALLTDQAKVIRLFMYADFVTRATRVKQRDGKPVTYLLMRDELDNKVGLQDVFRKADYIIYNHYNVTIEEVKKQINMILEKEELLF